MSDEVKAGDEIARRSEAIERIRSVTSVPGWEAEFSTPALEGLARQLSQPVIDGLRRLA